MSVERGDSRRWPALEFRTEGVRLSECQQQREIAEWIGSHETLTWRGQRLRLERMYGETDRSTSDYTLLEAGGMLPSHLRPQPIRFQVSDPIRERRVARKTGTYTRPIAAGELIVLVEDRPSYLGRMFVHVWGNAIPGRSPGARCQRLTLSSIAHGRGARENSCGDGEKRWPIYNGVKAWRQVLFYLGMEPAITGGIAGV